MRISQKFSIVLATCTLLGACVGVYFWIYPLQLFPERLSSPPLATQLRASGFLYDPNTVYTLEFLKGGQQAIAAISPAIPTVSQRVYLGDAEYNNLSFSDNQAFLSVYRYQSAFGEAGGQLVDQIQVPQKSMPLSYVRPYALQGAMPTKTMLIGNELWIQVRHLRDVPHSGFEIYNIRTGKYVTTVDLGEDYIGIDWIADESNKKVYAFGNSDYLGKQTSPHIIDKSFKKKKTDYTVFFEIDTTTHSIQKTLAFDEALIAISERGLLYRDGLFYIVSGVRYHPNSPTDREMTIYPEFLIFSPKTGKILTRSPLPIVGLFLQYYPSKNHIYFFDHDKQKIVGFDIHTQKIVQTFDVPGVRDMVIRGDYLYCNQRFLFLGNDYQDPPKISIWDLRTGKEVQRIPGTFGPFALQF